MEAKEFEEQLNELETRVDRLRALYENWFRGYEKLEPQVARKDVERRVYGLRKELPRNTALRFRYNQLYQRYTSLTSYWGRTARQIEDGTHRLQLQRLRRKKETREERVERQRRERDEDDKLQPGSYELNLDESLSVSDLLDDLEMDEVAKAVDTPGPHSEPPPPAEPARARATFARPKRSSLPPRAPLMRESSGSSPPPSSKAARNNAWFDEEGDRPTGLHQPVPAPAPKPLANKPAAPLPAPSVAQQTNAGLGGLPAPGLRPGLPQAPQAPLPAPKLPAPAAAAPSGAGVPSAPKAPPVPAPAGASGAGVASAPKAPNAPVLPPPKLPPAPAKPAAPLPPGSVLKPAPVAPVGSPPKAAPAPPVANGVRPPPRPAPTQAGSTAVGRPAPTSPIAHPADGALNDQRMRRIYDEYTAARRKNNEGEVRYEALRTSIERMLPDLQKKHAGKQIDFEVVVKDGRVGLKPKPQ